MKKILFTTMVLLLGLSNPMKAENTDISTLENVVYIEPFSMAAGSQHTLSVKMKNAVEAEGFGFDLYLPDGVTVATDGDGFPMVELSTMRTTAKKTNSFDAAFQTDGCLRVLAASTNASTINGNDGEVVLITIEASAGISMGDYPVILRNIAISDTEAKSHRTDYVETTITITVPTDTRIILDENSTTLPDAADGVNVRVRRTINANEWSTICLPFAMSETQVKAAFGSDVQLAGFNDYEIEEDTDNNVVGIAVNFVDATAIEANHPYIINVSKAITEIEVDGVDIDAQDAVVDFDTSRRKNQPRQFVGVYTAGTTLEWGSLFLSGNQFWYSVGNTKIKAFRAYFNFYDLLSDFESNYEARSIRMCFEDKTTTGIKSMDIEHSTFSTEHYFDLQGRRVVKPGKGLYIKNGKKKVVK